MKKALSLLLALVMLIGVCQPCFSAYSASLSYAEDKLVEIEKTKGFVPGKTAAVTNNCYLFIAKVCEKLFGVTYNGEGLYENYKAKHSSGNYNTIATYTSSHLSPTSQDVEDIISFFVKYAMPGDIVHFGAYDKNKSKTHTFMVQSVSSTKLSLLHSNYNIAQYSKESCHIDDIIWSSFRSDPTKNVKNSNNTLYSINALFYNTMKIGGIGITINRYSKYEDKYHLVGASIPIIKTENTSPTAIKVKWDEINGAAKYIIQYKKTSESSYTTLSSECTGLSYEVKNLKIGTIYDFRVAAYVDGKWQGYSDVVAKKALPPTLSSINITTDGKGFKLSWGKRNDITGVRISRSTSENGSYSNIATITDNSIGSYTDEKNISYGKTYYYKIERFCKSGSEEFSTLSPAFAATYTLAQPQSVSVSRKSPTSVNIKWSPVKNANGYVVQFKEYGKSWKSVNVTGQNRVITGLKLGKTYYYRVKAVNAFGSS